MRKNLIPSKRPGFLTRLTRDLPPNPRHRSRAAKTSNLLQRRNGYKNAEILVPLPIGEVAERHRSSVGLSKSRKTRLSRSFRPRKTPYEASTTSTRLNTTDSIVAFVCSKKAYYVTRTTLGGTKNSASKKSRPRINGKGTSTASSTNTKR